MSYPEGSIIPRPEHPISRADIDVDVLKVLYRLHHKGHLAYLVGGGIRDLWLGKQPKDFDIATDAHPQEIRRIFRNSRIIGKRFRLVQVFFKGGKIVEVSTFRSRSEFDAEVDMLAPNNTFGSPVEDAQRRDLTINALFYNIADFSILDYVGGVKDLQDGIIRVVGPPEIRFQRDPVRMLRVLRHASRTGFQIDPTAWSAIQSYRHLIRLCSPARVRDELLKDFRSGYCRDFFQLMLASGLLAAIFPHIGETTDGAAFSGLQPRMQAVFGTIDFLTMGGLSLSEAFFWAAFLIPFLEKVTALPFQQIEPETVAKYVDESLSPLEFARGRRDEVIMRLVTVSQLVHQLGAGRRVSARLKRRLCLPEAWLLYHILTGASQKFFEDIIAQQSVKPVLPEQPPTTKRRRGRRRTHRKKVSPI